MESRDVTKASLLPMFNVKLCRVPHWVLMEEVFADYNIMKWCPPRVQRSLGQELP